MKLASLFVVIMMVLSLFLSPSEARPGKLGAIRKGTKVIVSINYYIIPII